MERRVRAEGLERGLKVNLGRVLEEMEQKEARVAIVGGEEGLGGFEESEVREKETAISRVSEPSFWCEMGST